MKTVTRIGFGGVFYTLWHIDSQIHYYTSPNGQHYPSYMEYRYNYIQNISTDIDKVKSLYPSLTIDEDLRGKVRSFIKVNKDEDLSPELLKFGKYAGCDIRDIVEKDFDYVLYMIDNYHSGEVWNIAKETPKYKKHIEVENKKIADKISTIKPLKSGYHKFTFERNINDDGCGYINISDNHSIELRFKDFKACSYNGFGYYLPIFKDGKAKRIKGKEIELCIEIIETIIYEDTASCIQLAKVLN